MYDSTVLSFPWLGKALSSVRLHSLRQEGGTWKLNIRTLRVPKKSVLNNSRRSRDAAARYFKKLKKMPIVSLNSTAEKTMRPDDLNKYGKALLQRLGIGVPKAGAAKKTTNSTAARIFVNTYIHNLSNCGLREDEGLFRFLCGSSLAGNTTADHYRSFTDPDGLENQYSYLRRLAPEEPIILDNAIDKSDPDYDVYRFSAPTTQDLFCLQMELDGVETGQTVSLFSRYGGDIRVEAE